MTNSGINSTGSSDTELMLKNFDRFTKKLEELVVLTKPMGKTIDYYLFPLRAGGKDPDTGGRSWKDYRNSLHLTDDAARKRIENRWGNIALVSTCDPEFNKDTLGIGVIDIDLDESGQFKLPKERVNQLIDELNSFTVRTRSGGYHIYFVAGSDLTKHMYEKCGTYNPHPRYKGEPFGELRLHNSYVVAVGSYVPPNVENDKKKARPDANGFYEIYRDVPIRIVNAKTIPDWVEFGNSSGFNRGGGDKTGRTKITVDHGEIARLVEAATDRNYSAFISETGHSLKDIVERDEKLKYLLESAENYVPYNSRSEADFAVAGILNKCGFACDQVWAILQTFRPYEKTFSAQYLQTTLSKFDWDHSGSAATAATVDKFPDTLPDKRCIIISSLPRTGKSYYGIYQMGQYETGIYVSQTHSIIKQQFELFSRLYPEKTSVMLYGKNRVCNHEIDGQRGRCKDCPLKLRANIAKSYPGGTDQMSELLDAAYALVSEHTHVGPENIPDRYCKYEILHCCERFVDFVFTVPHFVTSQETLTQISKRDIAVFDEDTTFAHFYPHSYLLGTYHYKGNGSFYNTCNLTSQQMQHLEEIHAAVTKTRDAKKHPENETVYSAIIGLINGIKEVYAIITRNSSSLNDKKNETDVTNVPITELKYRINEVRFVVDGSETKISDLPNEDKDAILRYLSRGVGGNEALMSVSQLFEPYLYPAELKPEVLQLEGITMNTLKAGGFLRKEGFNPDDVFPTGPIYSIQGANPRSLYVIADEQKLIRPVDCAEKYVLIGFSKAGDFARHIEPNDDERIELEKVRFKYLENYVVIALEGRGEDGKNDAHKMDERLSLAIKALMDQNEPDLKQTGESTPALILTSSKSNQQRLRNRCHEQLFDARREDIDDITREWLAGKTTIMYQNSTISRGVDIPFIDLIFVDKCYFAQPYLDCLIEYSGILRAYDIINDEVSERIKSEILAEKDSIVADETTNSVLRISPVRGLGEEQIKIIVMREMDLDKLHHSLSGMKKIWVPTEMDLTPVIRTVRDLITRVRPNVALKRGGGEELTQRTRITIEDIASVRDTPAIDYGKSFKETAEIFDTLRDECEKSRPAPLTAAEAEQKKNQKKKNRTKKKIAKIQRVMLCHPSFQSLKVDGRTTKTIQSVSLIRWTQEYSKKVKHTQNMCERALSDLMECHILRAEPIQTQHKGGNLKKDVVKTRYKLWMDSGSYANMFKEFPDINRANPFFDYRNIPSPEAVKK